MCMYTCLTSSYIYVNRFIDMTIVVKYLITNNADNFGPKKKKNSINLFSR